MKKNLILKTAINEITLNDLVSKLLNSDSLSIALCNANSVVRAYRNDALNDTLNKFDVCTVSYTHLTLPTTDRV